MTRSSIRSRLLETARALREDDDARGVLRALLATREPVERACSSPLAWVLAPRLYRARHDIRAVYVLAALALRAVEEPDVESVLVAIGDVVEELS